MRAIKGLFSLLLLGLSLNTYAGAEFPFEDSAAKERFTGLLKQLRCVTCDNQSLFDSLAPLSIDMKYEVYRQIKDGQNDQQIMDFMADRYGERILYQPSMNSTTLVLWLIPFVFLFGLLSRQFKARK